MGGLPKKVSVLKKYTLDQQHHLVVDAGNLLFSSLLTPQKMTTAKKKADAIASVLLDKQKMIFSIGYNDLLGGIPFLKQLEQKYHQQFLSANLKGSDNTMLFTPYTQRQAEHLSLGLIGLTGNRIPNALQDEVHVIPWQQALPPILTELEQKTDIIVLLSNYSAKENQRIAQAFDQIRIIFQAGTPRGNMNPQRVNNTLICQATDRGKYQGVFSFNWVNKGNWKVKNSTAAQLKKTNKQLQQVSQRVEQLEQGSGAQQKQKIKGLRKLARQLHAQKEALTRQLNNPDATGPTYQNHFIALTPRMHDDPETLELLKTAGVL